MSATTDRTGRFVGATPALVRPGSTDEVAAVLDTCRRHGLAVVPQGGNTGLVGGSVALAGEIVVDLAARDTATIGGMVATNAGGLHLVRYGGTRQQLLGVEAALDPDGILNPHVLLPPA